MGGPWPNRMHNLNNWHKPGGVKDVDMDTWGRFGGPKNPVIPGPPYGKPGYKESHRWESAVDAFSPVVFNKEFYAAQNGLQGQTIAEIREDWLNNGLGASTEVPNCRQANEDFSINKYYEANKAALDQSTGTSCRKILNQYLGSGIYVGNNGGATSVAIRRKPQPDADMSEAEELFTIKQGSEGEDLVGSANLQPSQEYTLSFWIKAESIYPPETNILQYGNSQDDRSPAIFFDPGSTNMKFYIQQSDSVDFHCALANSPEPGDESEG